MTLRGPDPPPPQVETAVSYPPTRPEMNVWQQFRPSPVADLIKRHRDEMARIWQRHGEEDRRHDAEIERFRKPRRAAA
jgi:hypothetical protein